MEKLYTKIEVAEYLRISTKSVDRIIVKLDIPTYVVGRQIRIPESSLSFFIQKKSISNQDRNEIINNFYGG